MCAALVAVACGGAPPAYAPNGGCTGVWSGTECVRDVTVGGVAPTATVIAPQSTAPATTPTPPVPQNVSGLARVRDPRASLLRTRALPLLVTEIQQLEALAAATPDTQPDKPQLVRRLAENYVELEASATTAGRPSIAAASQKEAIKYYDLLVARFTAYPMLDEVRYFDALEHERSGDLDGARRRYFEVISQHPTSRYVPYAYFAFGEMFLSEGASDPSKLGLALSAYQKVVAAPPPENRIYGWGWLRIGNVEEKTGNAAEAREAYAKAKEFATTYAQVPGSADLAAAVPP